MASLRLLTVTFVISIFSLHWQNVHCDCYLHNPRGSNDRLNGAGQNRRNGNRLFDSQNNAKGGYNVGEIPSKGRSKEELQYYMKYFMSGSEHKSKNKGKSLLVVEWTNQHGCADRDLNCDIILQYRCQDQRYGPMQETEDVSTMKNGQSTGTIPYRKKSDSYLRTRSNKYKAMHDDVRMNFGMHESWEWYDKCNRRKRNQGLFTADQNLKGDTSIYTRQNPQGTRHGYECPEERDYYPYWHPTDWKDIAVMANSEQRCEYYRKNSFNTNKKGECLQHFTEGSTKTGFKHFSVHNNPSECQANGGVWVDFTNFLEERPDYTTKEACEKASTKDVPLVWGVPYVSEEIEALEMDPQTGRPKESCLVKLPEVDCRKADYSRANHLGNAGNALPLNYTWVLPYFPSELEKRCVLRIRYNISTMDYDPYDTFKNTNNEQTKLIKNDPVIKATKYNIPLQLAVNTAQFGRTFQDRSHIFCFKPRRRNGIPNDMTLHNLNVRGKRGNIVQVYPAVEYDFVPTELEMSHEDGVHVQFTGSNRNPGNNAGEGRRGTDRSNIVEMKEPAYNIQPHNTGNLFQNATIIWSANRFTKTNDDLAVSMASAGFYVRIRRGEPYWEKQGNRRLQFQNQLDNSSPSFGGVVFKAQKGVYYLMCTRNNNFSNRNQKSMITVR